MLANHMLRSFQPVERRVVGFKPAVLDAFLSYRWPGNVRELQNCIQRAIALAAFDHIGLEDLPESVRGGGKEEVDVDDLAVSELITAEELERRYIARVMVAAGQNKTLAARILGVDRRTLYRKLAAHAPTGRAGETAMPSSAKRPMRTSLDGVGKVVQLGPS
jgi:two-component system, NtrC family, response regulator AtoC